MVHAFIYAFDPSINFCLAGIEASSELNQKAFKAKVNIGWNICHLISDPADKYLDDEWDYVISVCGGANENCPAFLGKVKRRLHIGFDDPSHVTGTDEFIWSEFIRVREEIRSAFYKFYIEEMKTQLS
jgi:arsenate reductase